MFYQRYPDNTEMIIGRAILKDSYECEDATGYHCRQEVQSAKNSHIAKGEVAY